MSVKPTPKASSNYPPVPKPPSKGNQLPPRSDDVIGMDTEEQGIFGTKGERPNNAPGAWDTGDVPNVGGGFTIGGESKPVPSFWDDKPFPTGESNYDWETQADFDAAIAEIIAMFTGEVGDPLDRAVTLRDLQNPDVVTWLNDQQVSVTRPEQASYPAGEAPEPPRNLKLMSVAEPTRLTALNIFLTWTNPTDESISHFEVWVNTANNRSTAVRVGIVTYPQNDYTFASPIPGTTYYFWVRSVNWAGNFSTWEPTGVTNGYEVPQYATIDESINRIISALQGETPATYSAATTYQIGDQVKFTCEDGGIRRYQCVKDEDNVETNGKFDTDTAWTKGTGWSIDTTKKVAVCDGSQIANTSIYQDANLVISTTYTLKFTVKKITAGQVHILAGTTGGTWRTTTGTFVENLVCAGDDYIRVQADADFIGEIDNVCVSTNTGGSGITGLDPELGYPTWWKRLGILLEGEIDGISTVAIDGNFVVDGTILARHIDVESLDAITANIGTVTAGYIQSANWSAGSAGFQIDLTNAQIDSYESGGIKLRAGSDIELYGAVSNPAKIQFYDKDSNASGFIDSADALTLRLFPSVNNTKKLYLGYAGSNYQWNDISLCAEREIWHRSIYHITDNYVYLLVNSAGGGNNPSSNKFTFYIKDAGNTAIYNLHYQGLRLGSHKTLDMALSDAAWDDAYADDWNNVADFYFMDEREENGKVVPIDDVAVIQSIQPSKEVDPRTGFRLINDSTLPKWLVVKQKDDGETRKQFDNGELGDIIRTWKRGDVAVDPDGKPYLSTKTMLSLLMGAVRQLDDRLKNLEGK